MLASRRPDLVLLDLRLPDEPGVVLAREMRSDPELARVPILAVTASVLEADRRAGSTRAATGSSRSQSAHGTSWRRCAGS